MDVNFNYIYTTFWENGDHYVRYNLYLRPSTEHLFLLNKYYNPSLIQFSSSRPIENINSENKLVCLSETIKQNLDNKGDNNLHLKFTFSRFYPGFNLIEEVYKYEDEIIQLYIPKSIYHNEIFIVNIVDYRFNIFDLIDINIYPRIYPHLNRVFKKNILTFLCHSYSYLFMYKLNYRPIDPSQLEYIE